MLFTSLPFLRSGWTRITALYGFYRLDKTRTLNNHCFSLFSSTEVADEVNDLLEWERNTWSLLLALYKDRLETLTAQNSDMQIDESPEVRDLLENVGWDFCLTDTT